MAGWPVYSTRILTASPYQGWQAATIPAGWRAVINDLTFGKPGTAAVRVLVTIQGRIILEHNFQAASSTFTKTLRVVAFGTEVVEVYMDSANAYGLVCGFLFQEGMADALELETSFGEQPRCPPPPVLVADA